MRMSILSSLFCLKSDNVPTERKLHTMLVFRALHWSLHQSTTSYIQCGYSELYTETYARIGSMSAIHAVPVVKLLRHTPAITMAYATAWQSMAKHQAK